MLLAGAGIVSSTTGSNYHVRILSTINRELLKPSSSVALHRHSNAVVDVLPPEADSSISMLSTRCRFHKFIWKPLLACGGLWLHSLSLALRGLCGELCKLVTCPMLVVIHLAHATISAVANTPATVLATL